MRALVLAAAILAPTLGGAEGWAGFYTPEPSPAPGPAALSTGAVGSAARGAQIAATDVCVSAILAAQQRYKIPGNLLLAVGLQEAGLRRDGRTTVWPWSVNAAGDGRMFQTEAEALKWVRASLAAGVASVDVGCMQVNLRWHPDAFGSLEQAFDPVTNVDYAARFLLDLYARSGNWMTAAGSYHSLNDNERSRYLASLQQNLAVANARAVRPGLPGAGPVPALAELAPPQAPPVPQPDIAWSASLSLTKDSRRLSIYSTQDLQPILPNFKQEF